MSDSVTLEPASFIERLLPPTWRQIGIAAAVLALLALATIMLDGLWAAIWHDGYWSIVLTAPTVIIYILIVARVMVPFQVNALHSLRRLSALADAEIDSLIAGAKAQERKWAPVAFVIGFLFGLLATSPWNAEDGFSWLLWYLALLNGVMFGLIALVLQTSVANSRLTSSLQQGPLEFDIFYTSPFLPIGLHSLISALAFVGGSTIVIFFTAFGRQGLLLVDLILHGLLILITLLIFFLPLRQSHRVLRAAKVREQDNLNRHLAAAYRRLEQMNAQQKEDILPFATEVSLWQEYEKRLKSVPTWPFNAGILRTLFASILIPILVTLGQRVMAYLLTQLGIN